RYASVVAKGNVCGVQFHPEKSQDIGLRMLENFAATDNTIFVSSLVTTLLAKRIIPCLDVDNGRVVKGIRFISLTDAGDPVAQAKRYDAEGGDELTFLDITPQ